MRNIENLSNMKLLVRLRLKNGYKVSKLLNEFHVSRATLYHIENGHRPLTMFEAKGFADFYNISIEEIGAEYNVKGLEKEA